MKKTSQSIKTIEHISLQSNKKLLKILNEINEKIKKNPEEHLKIIRDKILYVLENRNS